MWARAATMHLFYQVAFLQFTLWGIRVALLKIIKFDAWLVARQIMFLIHIVAIAAVLCKIHLFSGVSVTHGTQANFSQGIQVHHPLRSQMCALFVAHPITAAQLIVVSALPHLAWLQSLHLWSHHLLPLLPLVATLVVAMFLQLLPLLAKVMAMAAPLQLLHLVAMVIQLRNLHLAMAMAMARAALAILTMTLRFHFLLAMEKWQWRWLC